MANYDQSGNPVGGDRKESQQGGYASGQAGARPGPTGQQSQYSGNEQGRGMQPGRGMQQSAGRGMTGYGSSSWPDAYSGAGPFALISRLSDEMDRLFETFGMGGGWPTRSSGQRSLAGQGRENQSSRGLWAPRIEVAEREGKLLVQADLPGVRKEDVDVQIEDDAVIIQGRRVQETERTEQGFYHSERSYGSFYRLIPLPDGTDAEQANATFRDGVLRIEVPLAQQRQRGRRLEIGEESTPRGQVGQAAGPSAGGQARQAQPGGTQAGSMGQQGAATGAQGQAGQQSGGR